VRSGVGDPVRGGAGSGRLGALAEPTHELADLDRILAAARESREQWTEFMRAGMFSAGVYLLAAGEPDRQTPHAEDEIYCVLEGRAELEIAGEAHPVEPGSVAFVAKRVDHRFVNIGEDLEVLVLFAPPESG
jgi:mannose-6-phosphate isomerase-like protein (cupin superfamily)